MFKTCGVTLHKWNSNNSELLDIEYSIVEKHLLTQLKECTTKTKGMVWNPKSDSLNFKVSVKEKTIYTKREVLSTIAKLYDPFGLIRPVITKSKIFLQKLWLKKINWDDSLPNISCIEWNNFVSTLKTIENISINRYLLTYNSERIILLGYCDASIAAYGAVVYVRSYCENYTPTTKLLASKSRVTSKKTISIPRLELCSCLLLSQSPNFGGLWDAGVKSFKYHLKRTIGNFNLTIEEFLTVVNQVEGILNSRPLIPLSSDTNDFSSLTPGHFLIGRPINSIPESKINDIPDNQLSRWQQVQKINQIIWEKWSRDYLNNLQQRGKWKFEKTYPHRPMTLHSPTENSLAVLNHKILEANSQVQNVKLGGHQTCLSINRLWHELCDMLRRLVGTTAPVHHDCSIQE
ncbi:reverse transcriptase domain-containing protein [Trichonephila clavipes]|nr:reverse transcriptase domain-containing protein [Trichonephila clavipes]